MAFDITILTRQLTKPIMQDLTSTGQSTAQHEPGYTVPCQDGREFQYVQFDSSGIAAVAGAPCTVARTTSDNKFIVTADVSDGSTAATGIFLSVLTDTYYGWIQTKGFAQDCPCTDGAGADVAVGDPLGATADLLWTKITVGGTIAEKAIALEAGASGFANIMLIN